MSVKLPKETVKQFAKLRLINLISEFKKDKQMTADSFADLILDTLETELKFTVVDDGE